MAVHGGWGDWSEWNPCSDTCGGGVRTRDRSCDSPTPAHGGNLCGGPANQTEECNMQECPGMSSTLSVAPLFKLVVL